MKDFSLRRKNRPGSVPGRGRAARSAALERLVGRSLAMLAFERAWRILVALLTLLGFFLALSWAGLWLEIGASGRVFGVVGFAAAALFALARGLAAGAPRREQALARLDAAPGAEHRLASSLDDTLAGASPEAATQMLWALHRRRLEAKLRMVAVAPPAPGVAKRDPLALRALALVAALAAGFVAGPDRRARIEAAFDWGVIGPAGASRRVDAWLEPPAYTGRPPIVLSQRDAATDAAAVAAPVNSILIVRSFGDRAANAQASGGLAAIEGAPRRAGDQEREERFKLTGDARLSLRGAPGPSTFDLVAIADRPPTIELVEEPRNNARGSMTLRFRVDDDYGVIAAEAVAAPSAIPGEPSTGRALYPPPRLALALPPTRAGLGESRATLDLADHPWAGARVAMTLVVHDEGGNEGASAPLDIVLPQRHFAKPLARALAEQRRRLALDADHYARVRVALGALSLGPELFQTPSSVYLGLSAAKRRLERPRGDDDLRDVADLLWSMALGLEDGDVSQAERDLRAAQKDLRDALARGADEQELERLNGELRRALDNFLAALAQQGPREAPPRAAPGESGQRTLSEQDIQSMLSEIEKAEKSGDFAEAQRLLDDLQDMLENLQSARAGEANPAAREMSHALDELDRLSREQQQLRDDTNRSPQSGGEARRGKGAPSEDESAREMRARQQALREKLEQQQNRLRRSGEETPQDLADADKAMKEAEKALGPGGDGKGRAVDAQGRALQALRRGADQLASRLQEDGEEGEDGQSGRRGRRQGMGQGEGADPLGRPSGRRRVDGSGSRHDLLGLPSAARARRVQEELRRRLGQPERPAEELDYLERLLRR
ncbi:MAG: TIGR02302 family protein [Methylocystaceae bacterium]|nr:MAG: TIGR02302 family protein [Methylocystaceae bacterium]